MSTSIYNDSQGALRINRRISSPGVDSNMVVFIVNVLGVNRPLDCENVHISKSNTADQHSFARLVTVNESVGSLSRFSPTSCERPVH